MATQEQLEAALRNAATRARQGDERAAMAARRFAAELKAMRGQPAQPKTMEELTPGLSTNPTDGMSGGQRFAAGFGKSFADTALGIGQMATEGGGLSPVGMGIDLSSGLFRNNRQALADQAAQVRERDAPLMATDSGVTGNIIGQVAQTIAVPSAQGSFLAKLAGAGATGGTFAASQPVVDGESRLANTAAGTALSVGGQGIASGAQRVAGRVASRVNPEIRKSIELARQAGIPLNVSQTTDSGAVKAAQAVTRYLPFSGAASSARGQQEAFNRAVGRSFGVDDAAQLSDDVMEQARQRLSGVFNDIYDRNDVALTPDVARRMVEVANRASADMTEAEAKVVQNQLDKIISEAGDGVMSGRKYQSVRTALQSVEQNNASNAIGTFVRQLRSALDDAAVDSVSPEDAAALAKVRSQWANFRTTQDALRQIPGAAGNVRPASLYPLIRKGSTKEMRALAKIGQNVLKDGLGDPGTAQRLFYQQLLSGGTGVTAAAGAYGAGGLAALPALGKGMAIGALAGRFLNSNTAAKALQQGRPTSALARLVQPAPKVLPLAYSPAAAAFNAGMVTDRRPVDPADPLVGY